MNFGRLTPVVQTGKPLNTSVQLLSINIFPSPSHYQYINVCPIGSLMIGDGMIFIQQVFNLQTLAMR